MPATLLVVLASILAGCAKDESAELRGGWKLVEAQLPDGHWSEGDGGAYSMQVSAKVMQGNFACTTFGSASYVQDGRALRFASVETGDMRGCSPDDIDPMEGRFVIALRVAEEASRESDVLTLTGPGTRLVFEQDGCRTSRRFGFPCYPAE